MNSYQLASLLVLWLPGSLSAQEVSIPCSGCTGEADADTDASFDPETLATYNVSITIEMDDGQCAIRTQLVDGVWIFGADCVGVVDCMHTITQTWWGGPVGGPPAQSCVTLYAGTANEVTFCTDLPTDNGSGGGQDVSGPMGIACGSSSPQTLSFGGAMASATATCKACN